ncbi:MAG: MFS transporter [Alphaproteobacteria bacterium]|nr:MFS transporter [Alphaproteobacteria bacterium]
MEPLREIDVGELMQDRRIGRLHVLTFCLCMAILFVDGLDYSSVNVAAPALLRAFGAERSAMGFMFSMGFTGILIGSVIFGIVGDKYGRKTGAVLGVLAYSVPALLSVFATSFNELTIYRLFTGLGIGGVIPNIVALLSETAPKRYRVTFVMAVFIGYSMGNAAIGQVAAWLIPEYGWQIVFLVAGISGLGLSAVLILFLPESIPFLAATKPESPRLRALVARMAPELAIGPQTRFTFRRPAKETTFSLSLLFDGYRRVATPIIWLAFLAESMTYLTLSAWFVVLLEGVGLSVMQAALAYSYAQVGAIVAILMVARLFDRFGPVVSVFSACTAVAAIIALGLPGLTPVSITAIAIVALACGSATHQSLIGMVGNFYPTIVRGNGVGYATGMGRIGAILGPAFAGYLLTRLPIPNVLIFIAVPDLVVAVACLGLARFAREARARQPVA